MGAHVYKHWRKNPYWCTEMHFETDLSLLPGPSYIMQALPYIKVLTQYDVQTIPCIVYEIVFSVVDVIRISVA